MNPFVCVGLLACSSVCSGQIVQTVLNNGTTQTRYDLVILGDGYQATEQTQFDQDVMTFLTALFQKQPYQTFAAYYNVHTVFRASVESGADRPDEIPPVYKNTVYNATYNYGGVDRCLYIQNTSQALADAALAPATEGRVLVMVNDSRYGGCAATFAVSYNGPLMSEVQIHEMGHSIGQLADEYDYPLATYTGPEPVSVNITTSSTGQKWSVWHGTDGISAFLGAGYYAQGLYRPKVNCLMRALGQPLCRVCQENIVKITNSLTNSIVATSPPTTGVTVDRPNLQPFAITHIVPPGNNPSITWKLDGQVLAGATGTGYTLDSTAVAVGNHSLAVSVLDQTTLVRSDPGQVMLQSHSWQVVVADPNAAQLRFTALTASALNLQRGDPVTLSATITNDGPAAASAFDIEFFLSPTPSWSAQSTYLGKLTLAGLAAQQTSTVPHVTSVPWSLLPQPYHVFAVADRAGVIPEGNENDNERTLPVFGVASPCSTKLEYLDPLLHPFDAAAMSLTSGGTLHPTVVAPCANPATTLYLIAWGGSGTSPGLVLSPTVLLPLNPDGLTNLGLDGLNGAVFGAFFGILDAEGLGRATFTLPPAVGLPLATTHFAAVLLGTTELFTAASNPIRLTLAP